MKEPIKSSLGPRWSILRGRDSTILTDRFQSADGRANWPPTDGPAVRFLIDPLPSLGQQQVHVTRYFDVIIGAWWLTNFPANWKSNVRVTVKTGYTVSIRGAIRSACLHGVELPFAVGKKVLAARWISIQMGIDLHSDKWPGPFHDQKKQRTVKAVPKVDSTDKKKCPFGSRQRICRSHLPVGWSVTVRDPNQKHHTSNFGIVFPQKRHCSV